MWEDPLWENSRVPRSCLRWSTQTCLWTMMILHIKNYDCKDMENELKKLSQQEQIEQILYGCRIPDCCWSRTVFHDERHWSILTIHRLACREYTLPRDEETSEPKGWIRGNTKIGPVLEVTTCCLQGKYGVEIRIMSVNKDNSHSWVRISHGLNKLVTDLNNKRAGKPQKMQFGEYASRLNASDFASRSKAKAKPQIRDFASSSTRSFPIGERTWTDVEPSKQSLSDYPVSKKLIHLLRHGSLPRDNDGAIEFWRIKDNFQKHFLYWHHWSDEKWKNSMAGGVLLILHYRTMSLFWTVSSGTFITSDVQSVYIPSSIQDWLSGGQILSNRQTVFFLPVDSMEKEHKDPDTIDLEAPRLAQYMHKALKKHQNTVYWVDINFALKKGLKFYQTRSNAIILHETLPAYCKPTVVRMETGEVKHEMVYASPRPLPKISWNMTEWKIWVQKLLDNHKEKLLDKQKVPTQANQIQNPDHDKTVKPVVCPQRGAPHSQEIETRSFREEAVKHDSTEKLVVCSDENHERPTVVCSEQASHPRFSREGQNLILEDEINHDRTEKKPVVCPQEGAHQTSFSRDSTNFNVADETNHDRTVKLVVCRDANHERSILNEVDIDFRIPGLPHSVVKQADNYRVRELVKKIENHPRRQSLQRDLQQNNAYNPFSEKSKKMIKDMGSVELFELFETDP